jgi:large repetitive protein
MKPLSRSPRARRRPERPSAEVLEPRCLLTGNVPDILDAQGIPLSTAPAIPNTAIQIATFDAPGTTAVPGDYSASIDWGDGTTTAGAIGPNNYFIMPAPGPSSAPNTLFSVSGTHTYAQAGTDAIQITITDEAGRSVTVAASADVKAEAIQAQYSPVVAYPGTSTGSVVATTFTDSVRLPNADYTASIDWGDGTTPSVGTVQSAFFPQIYQPLVLANPNFPSSIHSVVGEHTYAQAGTYTIHVTITSLAGATGDESHPTTVADISTVSQNLTPATNVPLQQANVGEFDVANPNAQPSDFTATIDWGDGTSASAGVIQQLMHILPMDNGPAISSIGSTPVNFFDSTYPRFYVTGDHTYVQAGSYTIKVSITDNAGHSGTITSTASVTEEKLTNGLGLPVAAAAGSPMPSTELAQFVDSSAASLYPNFFPNNAGTQNLQAVIDWGDGSTPTAGTIGYGLNFVAPTNSPIPGVSAAGSSIVPAPLPTYGATLGVYGSHTYATMGSYAIHITITSVSGAQLGIDTTAVVSTTLPPVVPIDPVPIAILLPVAIAPEVVAHFVVSNPKLIAKTLTAKINWGDGTAPTTGTVVVKPLYGAKGTKQTSARPKSYEITVEGVHTYSHAGRFSARTTLTLARGPARKASKAFVVPKSPGSNSTPGGTTTGNSHHTTPKTIHPAGTASSRRHTK